MDMNWAGRCHNSLYMRGSGKGADVISSEITLIALKGTPIFAASTATA